MTALEGRKAELDALIGSARRQLGTPSSLGKTEDSTGPELSLKPTAPVRRKGRKRVMSKEARARIAEAQRKRWAASRKQAASPAKAKAKPPATKRRTMSPEARKRIAEAQRKRWAAVRKEK